MHSSVGAASPSSLALRRARPCRSQEPGPAALGPPVMWCTAARDSSSLQYRPRDCCPVCLPPSPLPASPLPGASGAALPPPPAYHSLSPHYYHAHRHADATLRCPPYACHPFSRMPPPLDGRGMHPPLHSLDRHEQTTAATTPNRRMPPRAGATKSAPRQPTLSLLRAPGRVAPSEPV